MDERAQKVEAALRKVRAALSSGVDRASLQQAKDALVDLAGETALWSEDSYAPPAEDERQARYMIAQDDPEGMTLYLNVMRPGKKIMPHNHTTWACIAGVEGVEENVLYDRIDDGSREGVAEIRVNRAIDVGPGSGVAMLPDDIHHVEINGDAVIRHLHLYGRPLEKLTDRTIFDPEAGTCRIMDIGVKTQR